MHTGKNKPPSAEDAGMREEPHVYYSRLVGVTGVGPWSPVPQGPEVRGQLNGNEDDFQYDGRSGKLAAHSKRKHPVDGGVEILPARKASSEKIAMNRPVTIQRSGIQNAEAKCIPADNKGYQVQGDPLDLIASESLTIMS